MTGIPGLFVSGREFNSMTSPSASMQLSPHEKVKGWSVTLIPMRKHGVAPHDAGRGAGFRDRGDAEERCWHRRKRG
jgi:hypothetical protein